MEAGQPMTYTPRYRRCQTGACPMLIRAPAVVCRDHAGEMAGEWAAAEIAQDRARVPVVPTSADPPGASGAVAPFHTRDESSL